MIIWFILSIVLSLVGGGIFAVYFYIRQESRDRKNYERGLKMVPMLIHLPPLSDDNEANGRDARDLVDENISKAQVLYSILSSTFVKGFKAKYYGQRHIAFEVVAAKGFVNFYTAVPVSLVSVVQQAVVSAYPNARLEEVAEHNIFNPVGKMSGTIGGELVLKENYAYPIATFQELKRDTMQSLLNALSTLDKEDGAGVQILIRPADPEWRKQASAEAEKKRKGGKDRKGADQAFWWFSQLFTALVKPPEEGGADKSDPKPVSGLDQSLIESIEEKTRHPGFEVLIRVIASSSLAPRSQNILSNMVASFALFDSQGKNGFKYVPAKDPEDFTTSYILRMFPQEKDSNILNSVELASMFHFPDQANIPTTQLERQASKQVDGPRNIAEDGLLLGYNVFRDSKKAIRLSLNDRRRHLYTVGQTGTGKSTFIENLALQDMLEGRGFAFIDPHGDAAERLLCMVPKERTEDVIYFCPSDMDYPLGLNLFEFDTPEQKDFLIQEVITMLYKLYDPTRQGIIGPRYEHIFRNCALLLMSDPQGGTMIDIPKLLVDNDFMRQKLQYVKDQTVLDFWTKEYPNSQRSNESGEVTSWVVSKFGAFVSNEMMRNIIGQTKSSFDLREVMDEGKILLVNLSKGRTGELNSKLLGMIFVMKFQAAAMSRANIPENERKDFCLYVDEFQNFSTDSFADILSEARKYRLNLVVANQFITQLSDEIRDAIFGNVGTVVAHRVGTADAEALSKLFSPTFNEDDLERLPNYQSIVRMLIGGVPTQSFSMTNLPVLGNPNQQLGQALKQLSAAKHGKPKAVVESEIFKRLASPQKLPAPVADPLAGLGAAPRSGGALPPAGGAAMAAPGGAMKPASSSSFLDDWLAKRKAAGLPVSSPGGSGGPKVMNSNSAPAGSVNPFKSPQNAYEPGSSLTPPSHKPAATSFGPAPDMPPAKPDLKDRADDSAVIDSGENISSLDSAEREVENVADELRKNLHPEAQDKESKQPEVAPTEHFVDLKQAESGSGGGMIVIDKEGNLSHAQNPENDQSVKV